MQDSQTTSKQHENLHTLNQTFVTKHHAPACDNAIHRSDSTDELIMSLKRVEGNTTESFDDSVRAYKHKLRQHLDAKRDAWKHYTHLHNSQLLHASNVPPLHTSNNDSSKNKTQCTLNHNATDSARGHNSPTTCTPHLLDNTSYSHIKLDNSKSKDSRNTDKISNQSSRLDS